MNLTPFIDGSYGTTVLFLVGIFALTYLRYRSATKRLAAVEKRP
ncbi:MAG: heme exporter protein CcmD [Acidocella sp.]|nr:heme exporter protein CcmD [Acidocella sp.]